MSNFEHRKHWKYKQLWGLRSDSTCLWKKMSVILDLVYLVCLVVSSVYSFIRFPSFFFGFSLLFFFLFYYKTILKTSSVSETSSYFLVRFQCSTISFNFAFPSCDNLRNKGCQKGRGFWFWFVFSRVEIQKCELKSTSHELKSTSSKFYTCSSWTRVTSSTLLITSSNPRVTIFHARVTSSNPRVMSSRPRVTS